MHERRFHPSQAHKLEDPERRKWLPPDEIVAMLQIQPGWTVADIGAGTGYFTLPLAHAVGDRGRIFAVDVATEMLQKIGAKLDASTLDNVECIEGEASSTGIPPHSCHCAFLANVWHEFDDRGAVLREAKRILKPGGCIAILDWSPDVEPVHGPPLEHRISEEHAVSELEAAGFGLRFSARVGYSWLITGDLASS